MDKGKHSRKNVLNSARASFKSNIAFNIIIGIVVMLGVFAAMAQLLGYVQFSDEFTKEYTDNAFYVAKAASSYVNGSHLEEYLESKGNSHEYQQAREELNTLCNKVNARFIYVIIPSEDYNQITFVYNVVNTNSGFEAYEPGYVRETTNDDYRNKYMMLMSGFSTEEYVVRDKGFIESDSHITAMVPIKNSGGVVTGILCVQRQMDALTTSRRNYVIKMFAVVIALIVMSTFIYDLFLDRYLIKPLRKITRETARFAEKQSKPEYPITSVIKSKNEIWILAESIDKMEMDTLNYIDNLTKVTAEKQRIGTELAVASAIQQGMLNAVAPDRSEVSIHATMSPAKEVGGDFYDFFMIDDDHMCMLIADVSGKGIPAALFMAISKVVIADSTLFYKSPAEMLKIVNERICNNNKLDMFVTVWLAVLELSTGKVIAANAGHEYPAICRKDKGFELFKDKHGFVVGGMNGVGYKDYQFTLDPDDGIFVYTDGVAEATDVNNQLFGTDRMIKALNIKPDGTPEEIIANVQAEVDKFVDKAPQFDDLTMLCVRYHGKEKKDK